MIEAIGAILGMSVVGLLYRIGVKIGKMDVKVGMVCEAVSSHTSRIDVLEVKERVRRAREAR